MKKFLLILSVLVLLINSNKAQNQIIDGVGEFLTERAEDNFFYIFQSKIENNKIFCKYFPEVRKIIETVDFKYILNSKELWSESVKNDLNNLPITLFNHIKDLLADMVANSLQNEFLELLQDAVVEYEGKKYKLNVVNLDAPKPIRDIQNNLATDIIKLSKVVSDSFQKVELFKLDSNTDLVKINSIKSIMETLNESIDQSFNRIDSVMNKITELKKSDGIEFANSDQIFSLIERIENEFEGIKIVLSTVITMTDSSSNTVKAIKAFEIIEFLEKNLSSDSKLSSESKEIFDDYFPTFKKIALFFAQISDADSASQVSTILKTYTLPSVSFGVKREPGKWHMFIQSYWGITVGMESINERILSNTRFYYGITAPIGLEFSRGLGNESSFSFFVSALEFGQVVNSQMFDENVNYTWADIVAPGLTFNYGFPQVPLAVGLGGYYGKSLVGGQQKEWHLFAHFSFDMPLVTLF